jgi:hypothetical protein
VRFRLQRTARSALNADLWPAFLTDQGRFSAYGLLGDPGHSCADRRLSIGSMTGLFHGGLDASGVDRQDLLCLGSRACRCLCCLWLGK